MKLVPFYRDITRPWALSSSISLNDSMIDLLICWSFSATFPIRIFQTFSIGHTTRNIPVLMFLVHFSPVLTSLPVTQRNNLAHSTCLFLCHRLRNSNPFSNNPYAPALLIVHLLLYLDNLSLWSRGSFIPLQVIDTKFILDELLHKASPGLSLLMVSRFSYSWLAILRIFSLKN